MVISPHHSAAAVYEEPRAMYFLYSQHYRCFNVSRPTMLLEKCASAWSPALCNSPLINLCCISTLSHFQISLSQLSLSLLSHLSANLRSSLHVSSTPLCSPLHSLFQLSIPGLLLLLLSLCLVSVCQSALSDESKVILLMYSY